MLKNFKVAKAIAQNDPAFSSQFTLVASEANGLSLSHKNGLPPLPTRLRSSYTAGEQQFCTTWASRRVVPTTTGTTLVNIARVYSGVLYDIPLSEEKGKKRC